MPVAHAIALEIAAALIGDRRGDALVVDPHLDLEPCRRIAAVPGPAEHLITGDGIDIARDRLGGLHGGCGRCWHGGPLRQATLSDQGGRDVNAPRVETPQKTTPAV